MADDGRAIANLYGRWGDVIDRARRTWEGAEFRREDGALSRETPHLHPYPFLGRNEAVRLTLII